MDGSPIAAHAASPRELRDRIEAERLGRPFLVFRADGGAQEIVELSGASDRLSIGRAAQNAVPCPGTRRSRACTPSSSASPGSGPSATTASRATGPSSTPRASRAASACATATCCASAARRSPTAGPEHEESRPTQVAGRHGRRPADLPPTQRQVLVALARPYKVDEFATPATNQQIADELHLSVDAVKGHLRTLFARFGIEHLAQNQKRSRLVAEALQSGLVSVRDL